MGSAASPNVQTQKVNIGSTSVSNPIFFIEYSGVTYGNSLRFGSGSSLSDGGITSRVVTITSDTSGNVYATSVGVGYDPDLPSLSINIKVHIVG
jgi:hypothetical protein